VGSTVPLCTGHVSDAPTARRVSSSHDLPAPSNGLTCSPCSPSTHPPAHMCSAHPQVFLAQKMLLRSANSVGKPCFVTRVMDSITGTCTYFSFFCFVTWNQEGTRKTWQQLCNTCGRGAPGVCSRACSPGWMQCLLQRCASEGASCLCPHSMGVSQVCACPQVKQRASLHPGMRAPTRAPRPMCAEVNPAQSLDGADGVLLTLLNFSAPWHARARPCRCPTPHACRGHGHGQPGAGWG